MNEEEEDNLETYRIFGYIFIIGGIISSIFAFITFNPVEGVPISAMPHDYSAILFTLGLGFVSIGIALISIQISIDSGKIAEKSKKRMDTIGDAEIEKALSNMLLYYDKLTQRITDVNALYSTNIIGNKPLVKIVQTLTINAFISGLGEFRSNLRVIIVYRKYINIYEHELIVTQSIKNIIITVKYINTYLKINSIKLEDTIEKALDGVLSSFNNLFDEFKVFNCYDNYKDIIEQIKSDLESQQPYSNILKNLVKFEKSLKELNTKKNITK